MNLEHARKSVLLVVTAPLAFLFSPSSTRGQMIIDVDSRSSVGVTIPLAAGGYRLVPITTAEGGAYTAWNPWSTVSGCNASGTSCSQGFRMHSQVRSASLGSRDVVANYGAHATAQSAFDAQALPARFRLAQAEPVTFIVPDIIYNDNYGGISFRLELDDSIIWSSNRHLSAGTGGLVAWDIDAGPTRAGQLAIVVGSSSGSVPGSSLLGFHLPLNVPDFWFGVSVSLSLAAVLDGSGRGGVGLTVPALPAAIGLRFSHAAILIDSVGVTSVTNAVDTVFVQ